MATLCSIDCTPVPKLRELCYSDGSVINIHLRWLDLLRYSYGFMQQHKLQLLSQYLPVFMSVTSDMTTDCRVAERLEWPAQSADAALQLTAAGRKLAHAFIKFVSETSLGDLTFLAEPYNQLPTIASRLHAHRWYFVSRPSDAVYCRVGSQAMWKLALYGSSPLTGLYKQPTEGWVQAVCHGRWSLLLAMGGDQALTTVYNGGVAKSAVSSSHRRQLG